MFLQGPLLQEYQRGRYPRHHSIMKIRWSNLVGAQAPVFFAGNAMQRASSILVTLLFVAFAGMSSFGRLEVYRTVTGLAAAVAVLGMDAALAEHIGRNEHAAQATSLRISQFILGVGWLLAAMAVTLRLFNGSEQVSLAIIFLAIGLAQSVVLVGLVIARIQRAQRLFLVLAVLMSFSLLLPLTVVFGYFGKDAVWSFGVVWWIGTAAAAHFIAPVTKKWLKIHAQPKRSVGLELLSKGLLVAPLGVLAWVIQSADRLVLYSSRGAEEVGLYSLASRLIVLVSLVLYPLQALWWPAAIRKRREGQPLAETDVSASVARLAAAVVFFMEALILWFASDLRMWTGIALLVLSVFMNVLYFFPVVPVLDQGKTFICTQAFLIGAAVNLATTLYLAPTFGFVGAAISTVLGYGSVLMFTSRRAFLLDGKKYRVTTPVFVSLAGLVAALVLYENLKQGQVLIPITLCFAAFYYGISGCILSVKARGDFMEVLGIQTDVS
jgi:O-antigen/teichoic acid export membrane protein